MAAQLEALASHELTLTRSDVTRATDTADSLLARLGVRDPAAAAFLRSDSTARLVLGGRGGKMVQAAHRRQRRPAATGGALPGRAVGAEPRRTSRA